MKAITDISQSQRAWVVWAWALTLIILGWLVRFHVILLLLGNDPLLSLLCHVGDDCVEFVRECFEWEVLLDVFSTFNIEIVENPLNLKLTCNTQFFSTFWIVHDHFHAASESFGIGWTEKASLFVDDSLPRATIIDYKCLRTKGWWEKSNLQEPACSSTLPPMGQCRNVHGQECRWQDEQFPSSRFWLDRLKIGGFVSE